MQLEGVLAERVRERRLARAAPRFVEADAALEELPVLIDERDERDGCVEQLRREPREAIVGVGSGRIEQPDAAQLRQAGRVQDGGRRTVRAGAGLTARQRPRGKRLQGHRRLGIRPAPGENPEAHDRRVADELRRADALTARLALEQLPEVLAEADGGGAHRHGPHPNRYRFRDHQARNGRYTRLQRLFDGGSGNRRIAPTTSGASLAAQLIAPPTHHAPPRTQRPTTRAPSGRCCSTCRRRPTTRWPPACGTAGQVPATAPPAS